ncbi:hypothetical protein CE143_24955 [Photorhabdus luminescens]|uniref:GAPS4 PD-(D/E)XK nuclease domain-containing protein n=1 Tax=Photorhabdus akhurstii TaxID=171438 RepID=A0ABX8M0L2_9GAMM|nr:hypothetical protein [Photorhabdus akhurstii]QXF36071.1 hypothetical protein B0X70_24915 [Photorhabdus akhurstii]UJD77911.1 hypothetical protein CE143_24955 [Photorhabdus luminescens]
MGGEGSKKSGEIGEALATALLERIGWRHLIHNISISCNTPTHLNDKGNARQSHGEDQVYLYNNPFHDDRTDFVHVSNKNTLGSYPKEGTLRSQFKSHIKELSQTIECAKHNQALREIGTNFKAKKNRYHAGLLIWFHNDHDNIEKNILADLAPSRLDLDTDIPFYVIDNGRATFLLKVVDDLRKRSTDGDYQFFYPRIGTSITVDEMRTGKELPLELLASDVIPAVLTKGGTKELIIYANESFDSTSYKNLMAYGLSFASGLITNIRIGMPDYNPAHNEEVAQKARLAFHNRPEEIMPFSFNRSILDLLQEESQ